MLFGRRTGTSSQPSASQRGYSISGPTPATIDNPKETVTQSGIDTSRSTKTPDNTHRIPSSGGSLRRQSLRELYPPLKPPHFNDLYNLYSPNSDIPAKESGKELPNKSVSPANKTPPLNYSRDKNLEQGDLHDVDLTTPPLSKPKAVPRYPEFDSFNNDKPTFNRRSSQSLYSSTYEPDNQNRDTTALNLSFAKPQYEDRKSRFVEEIGNYKALDMNTKSSPSQTKAYLASARRILIFIVGGVAVAALVIGVLALKKTESMKDHMNALTGSDVSTFITPTIASSTSASSMTQDTSSMIDATSGIVVTSLLETSDTPSPASTITSTLESSSVASSSSRSSTSSKPSVFVQSTEILDNLVGRSGYLGQRGDAFLYGPLAVDSNLDRRDDSENCEYTTITSTTTLTTTITSTFRVSKLVASVVAGNSALSQQPEPEPEPTGTDPECIPNTIMHTDELPTSSPYSYESDVPNMQSSSVAIDSTPSPNMTPSPTTTSPVTQPESEDTVVVSASSIAIARRLVAPLAWKGLRHLRRFLPMVSANSDETQQNRNSLPSLTGMPTVTTTNHDGDYDDDIQLLSTTSSNAAVRRQAKHWTVLSKSTPTLPSRIHERRQASSQFPSSVADNGRLTPWQAYSQLRLQLKQMCFSVKTYQNTTLTPVEFQTPEDLKMGEALNENVCNSLEQDFPDKEEGEKCDKKDVWESLVNKVEELCGMSKQGQKLVQDVALLCQVKESIEVNVEECDGDSGSEVISSQGGGSGSNLISATDGPPSADSMANSPTNSSLSGPISSSILLQANAVASVNSTSEFVITTSTTPSNNPATLSPSPGTGVPENTPSISATQALLSSAMVSPVSPTACPNSIPQISYPFKPAWSTPVLTSFPDPPTISTYGSIRLTGHGPNPVASIPCGYTSSYVSDSSVPNIVVPATSQAGELSFYYDQDAFVQEPACQNGMLVPGEAIAAIGWELYDWGRGGSDTQVANALCGRKIIASCAGNGEVEFARKEVELWVRDRCSGCRPMDLDVLQDVFKFCAHTDVGRAAVTWRWAEDGESVSPTPG